MSTGTTREFHLPKGWTVRKVANALVREWLPPFRAEPVAKAARWVVQPVVEVPEEAAAPLWEPGISTEEYEERMDRSDLHWAIRASTGRGKHTVLARLAMSENQPETLEMQLCQVSFPEALFDTEKMDQLLKTQDTQELFPTLLANNGIEPVTH